MKYSPILPAFLDEKAGDAAAPEGDKIHWRNESRLSTASLGTRERRELSEE
jgi:hypothetical protein